MIAEQTELVPETAADRVAKLRRGLELAADKADERVEKAEAKAAAARVALEEFDATIAAVALEAAGP
jgi:hypothetical protein